MPLTPPSPESARRWVAARVSPDDARSRALSAFDEIAAMPASAVVPAHADNAAYAGACLAAVTKGASVWCANPRWGEMERAQARLAMPPEAVWVDEGTRSSELGMRSDLPEVVSMNDPLACSASRVPQSAFLFIPTGGTGGRVRFVRHTLATLGAAAEGFALYAGTRLSSAGRPVRLHAVQALPCCHVSGLMPVVRAWLTDAEIVFSPPSFRADSPLPRMPASADGLTVVSLVAAQLFRLLERPDGPDWLRSAGLVLVGGSAIPPELLSRARAERVPVGVSYGLTEAAALVAIYPPEAFLRGDFPVAGEALPHVRVSITPEGRVALSGASLGEDVPLDEKGRFVTGDEGFLDGSGRLVVTGRADRIIVSGGEKVDPVEVEAALRASGLVSEALVVGEPDPEWGRRLVAIYTGTATPESLAAALAGKLAGFRLPRRYLRADSLPLDARGKLDHAALSALLRR